MMVDPHLHGLALLVALQAPNPTGSASVWIGGVLSVIRGKQVQVIALRYALIIYSIFGAVCVAADLLFFPNRIVLDVAALIFPVAYTLYFFASSRVRKVFVDRT